MIYIAGPMTGYENFNFPAFFAAEEWLEKQGYEVVNPARLDDGDTTKTWEHYIRRDLKIMLDHCNSIALLDGWEKSRGANIEAFVASQLGFQVFEQIEGGFLIQSDRLYIASHLNVDLLLGDLENTMEEWLAGQSVLVEAHNLVHGDRGKDYGHPYHDFSRTALIWSAILDIDITPQQVALCMIGVKISRECNKPKRDNRVDIAGYAETLDMVVNFK